MNRTHLSLQVLGRIIGNAGTAPVLQKIAQGTPQETSAVRFQVGVDRPGRNGAPWTEMHWVQFLGNDADYLAQYGIAGTTIFLVGDLRNDPPTVFTNAQGVQESIARSVIHARILEHLGRREAPVNAGSTVQAAYEPDGEEQGQQQPQINSTAAANTVSVATPQPPAAPDPSVIPGANGQSTAPAAPVTAGRQKAAKPDALANT